MTEPTPPVDAHTLNRWAEALSGIARTGLAYTTSSYEVERYHEILAVAADIAATVDSIDVDQGLLAPDEARSAAQLSARWLASVGDRTAGYVTPKVAIGAVVGDDDGRLLLIQRSDSGVWLYPTGWADVGYSPTEVAVKEVEEETGILCEVERLIGVFDGLRAGFSRIPLYSLVFLCRAVGGELRAHPQECLDVGFFARDELPAPVANFDLWGDHAFDAIAGRDTGVWVDQPRPDVWAGPESPSPGP